MKKLERKNWEKVDKSRMVVTGYVQVDNSIMRKIANEIDYQSVTVYIMLLSHKNNFTEQCNPSHKLIANECNVSISTIKNTVKNLKDHGIINIKHDKYGNTNIYEFPLEKLKENSSKESIF